MESNVKQRPPNPRKGANIFSVAIFGYTFGTFLKGYKRDFEEDDISEVLDQHQSKKLGDQLESSWRKELTYNKPSLWRALIRVFGLEIILRGMGVFLSETVLKLSQPILLFQLIKYYTQTKVDASSTDQAYLYAGLIVGVSFLNVLLVHHNIVYMQVLGMKAGVACSSVIYRKALKLSKGLISDSTSGQLSNLISNDISRFDTGLHLINTLWVCPTQLIATACILYSVLGLSSTIGVFLLALCAPLQVYLGRVSSRFRFKTALMTDKRVRLMDEIISGIQVIKMYTWEKPFCNLVAAVRRIEVGHIRSTSYIRGAVSCFIYFPRIAIFFSVLTYVLTGNVPKAEYVFVIAAFYSSIRQSVNMQFPHTISAFAELNISVGRLQKYLLMDEINTQVIPDIITSEKYVTKDARLELRSASASWSKDNTDDILRDVNMNISNEQLVAIIGPVGCGKTSILQVFLKELSLKQGTVIVEGKVSYASQEPWLFSASIQQNILFGREMDLQRYTNVLRVCALQQDLTLFPYGDLSLVGERGLTLSGGQKARISLARAVYADADIYLLDDPLSAVDMHVARQLFEDCIQKFLHDKCRVLITHQTQFLQNVDKLYLMEHGEIVMGGTYSEIKDSGINFAKYLQSSNMSENHQLEKKDMKVSKNLDILPVINKEQKSSGSISGSVYKCYFQAGGTKFRVAIVSLLFILAGLGVSFVEYFLSFWVNQEQLRASGDQNGLLPTSTCIYIYTSLAIFMLIFGYSSTFFFFRLCMESSINLHNNIFLNIVYAPLRFFYVNPSGRIINRFSKDTGAVDELLPKVAVECINISFTTANVIILICIVNPWLIIAAVIIFLVFYFITSIYLPTSRSVKRLEGITRSPVLNHINASLQGLTTIRAFKVQKLLQDEFDRHQDVHTSASYLFLICTRAFGFYLDLFSVIYIAIVIFSFFIIPTEYGGNVGLAITQALTLTGMLQWGTRQWGELQSYMTSVERMVEYTRIEPEDNRIEKQLPLGWPAHGKIKFQSIFLRYSISDPYVLKNLNFVIEAREKIGVVGRTGAGKSSLIIALFQLAPTEGSILLDDVDITQTQFKVFRSKISIIPQEPVLFSGSLRTNLDPFNQHSDEELWSGLAAVELKTLVMEMPMGLSSLVTEGGANYSVGQRQLLCLARAIIRKNNILILDEATANVDPQTDTIIQTTIRERFSNCTVITIAHRLNTVIDSDKILVLDAGKIIEYDYPYKLLQNETGMFYSMVQQNGQNTIEDFFKIAEKNYKKGRQETIPPKQE